jgi:serine/threonine protein kinase
MNEVARLGRYSIESLLGSGAYADVYRARDTALDRTVALKILRPAALSDEEAFKRFVQEAKVSSNLFHPQIAAVFDLGEAEGRFYLAMRFVDGLSVDKVIRQKGVLPWGEALQITRQVAGALAYAHAKGFIHRDVKPQNIILSASEGAVLTDFGLVKAMEAAGSLTRTNVVVGTPQYVPPEIWKGEAPTQQVDQYALACVLVEMLTGKALFEGPTPWAIMQKMNLPPALPENWPDGVPAGLTEVVIKGLAQEAAARYAGMFAFLEALEGLENQKFEKRPEALVAEIQAVLPTQARPEEFIGSPLSGEEKPLVNEENNTEELVLSIGEKDGGITPVTPLRATEEGVGAEVTATHPKLSIGEPSKNEKEVLTYPHRSTPRRNEGRKQLTEKGLNTYIPISKETKLKPVITWRGALIGLAVAIVPVFFLLAGDSSTNIFFAVPLIIIAIPGGLLVEYNINTRKARKNKNEPK